MAPGVAARRVDGVLRSSQGQRREWQRCLSREPVLSTALLPPDKEYGRDGGTRCNAEIRPALNCTSMFSSTGAS